MNQHLVLLDFDGTIANTFEESPNGWNVNKASEMAISEALGSKAAQAYLEIGGLKGREPGELIRDVLKEAQDDSIAHREATERFVQTKLSVLIPEISPTWPKLYPGAAWFLQKAGRDGYFVDVGILSSGHDSFISRALEVNGIDPTKIILVTSDVLKEREMPKRPRFKPHTYQFAEAHHQWLHSNGRHLEDEQYLGRSFGKPNILYVGDDPTKDGGLALEVRVPFVFVPFTRQDFVPDENKGQMMVGGFDELDDVLDYQHGDQLAKGWSFAQALFGRTDAGLFPRLQDGEVYQRILRERSFS